MADRHNVMFVIFLLPFNLIAHLGRISITCCPQSLQRTLLLFFLSSSLMKHNISLLTSGRQMSDY